MINNNSDHITKANIFNQYILAKNKKSFCKVFYINTNTNRLCNNTFIIGKFFKFKELKKSSLGQRLIKRLFKLNFK